MTFAIGIQKFLKQKLLEHHLTRMAMAQCLKMPYNSLSRLTRASKPYPDLKNLIKIADYFDCSIDEVIGQETSLVATEYLKDLSEAKIKRHLQAFIRLKLQEHSLTVYRLAKACHFSEDVIPRFLKEDGSQQTLGSAIIVALAHYFQVSIDEMIGRIPSTTMPN